MKTLPGGWRLLSLSIVLAAARALADAPAASSPRLQVDAVAVQGGDAESAVIAVRGRIENPGAEELSVTRFRYAVEVEGEPAGDGTVNGEVVVPPGKAARVVLPVTLRWSLVPRSLGAGRSLAFRVRGAALGSSGRGEVELPCAGEGTVTPPRPPSVELREAAVRASSVFETLVELRLELRNPNPFPLPGGRLAYQLSVGGRPVIRAGSRLASVPPGGTVSVVVPVRFPTSAAGDALEDDEPRMALAGSAAFGALQVAVDGRAPLAMSTAP